MLRKRIKALGQRVKNTVLTVFFEKLSLCEDVVYIESRSGTDVADNVLCILKELQNAEYKNYKCYVYLKKKYALPKRRILDECGLKNVRIIVSSNLASIIRSRAKYIISDTCLRFDFIKKPGQVVINTWHGTPFKLVGRSNLAEMHTLGHAQQAFLNSDYLIYPNEYMKRVMIKDYMLENVCKAKCLCSGYPRNSKFFDEEFCQTQRDKLGWTGQAIVYMPTWRGTLFAKKNQQQNDILTAYLKEIDSRLRDDQTFFVKLHDFNEQKIDLNSFKHIKPFPQGYPTYDVLAAADVLVTDYSSVFFDFANTRRKIVLFAYDEEEYFEDRGIYFPFSELPFEKVKTVDELIDEFDKPNVVDYSEFFTRFGYYDNQMATENICRHIFKEEDVCTEEPIPSNGKENVLIYAGSLYKNGITSSLINMLSLVDKEKRNYIVTYRLSDVIKEPSRVAGIPKDIAYIPIPFDALETIREHTALKKFLQEDLSVESLGEYDCKLPLTVERFIKREWTRFLGSVKIDKVIQYSGYAWYFQLLFALSGKPAAIWVHNDLIQEKMLKGRNSLRVLKYCYNQYSRVVLVNDQLKESILKLGAPKSKVSTVFNCFDYECYREKAGYCLTLDKNTSLCGATESELNEILKSSAIKFITIGRFSPEKGHERLLRAFERFNEQCPDSYLLIVGGYGRLFAKTVALATSLKCSKRVVIIKSLTNPAPLLKACDLFVLSSFHEGLPVVLFEAASLNIPVVSTKNPNVELFIKQHEGMGVENSEDGLFDGMKKFAEGNVPRMNINFDNFNRLSLLGFNKVLDELDLD